LKLEFRKLRANEDNYELCFGLIYVPLMAAVALLVSRVPGHCLPPCWLHRATGVPCPTCGAYRALTLGCQGRLAEAWLMQPLGVTAVVLAVVYSLYSAVVTMGRLPRLRLRLEHRRERRWLVAGILAAIVGNWIYLVVMGR